MVTDPFSPMTLTRGPAMKNRFMLAPLTNMQSHADGTLSDEEIHWLERRAEGGFGLTMTAAAHVLPAGQAFKGQLGVWSDDHLPGLKRLADTIRAKGSLSSVQLHHGGWRAMPEFTGQQSMGPFAHADTNSRAMTTAEVEEAVEAFIAAAVRCEQAGFDGVELHGANGYLLDQFLKDGANQRRDDYGGAIANRVRLTLEVVRAVVEAVGGGRVGIRLSPVTPSNDIYDSHPQPLFEHLAQQLAPLGLAYLHVIEGSTGGPREIADRPFDYAAFKAAYRNAGGRGAWMVNNGYDRALALQAVASGHADMVAFGRAYIANPDLVLRLHRDEPLNEWDRTTFYGGGAKGYIDYPALG